jgi:hypothetical protein
MMNILNRIFSRGRSLALPTHSKHNLKSFANTPANRCALSRKIDELQTYWADVVREWGAAELMNGAKLLSRGKDPGLGNEILQPVAALMLLTELERRWQKELHDEIKSAVADSV